MKEINILREDHAKENLWHRLITIRDTNAPFNAGTEAYKMYTHRTVAMNLCEG
jgi:hypothetical protein